MTALAQSSPQRAEWLRVLALSPVDEVLRRAGPALRDHAFEWLRRPEQGLVMVRARIANTGDRFNLGEATVTRCAVRHRGADGRLHAGVGHVMGRDERHAEAVAQLDALLQDESLQPLLWPSVIEPLQAQIEARQRDERAQAEASRVRFFTLQPEVN